ncbi:aminoglycoside phosphotransferase family protein [Streptomyces sp. A2-16]|uniref:phosphotransferase family protein n=1 Tax=Streptomyces sp. A2-16 TaxID=2781734 RepID=UPI001BAE7ADB|nr:aminoglycoside phosphotransferase family protein [Streptomyces sp. A2-16]QUC60705.1 aminoglycoside phosphotransferase family protein [Streptomyces sp. A2-16]
MTSQSLLAELTLRVRSEAHSRGSVTCPCGASTLADRPDATVVRHAGVVAKAHAPGTAPEDLAPRLAAAAHLPGILLDPRSQNPVDVHGRLVTFWPYGEPVDPENPDAAPWEAAATLLARLHRTPAPPGLPAMRGPVKAALAVGRLLEVARRRQRPDVGAVLRAWFTLPPWSRAETPMPDTTTLCHGDLHLGQLVRHPVPDGPWRLIDVDDLGVGEPAWDLARPAAWYACGLLSPEDWSRFLGAYREAGGPAVPVEGDPWPALDVPARALTVQTAARAIAKAIEADRALDDVEQAVVDACERMGAAPPELADGFAK